MPALVPTWSSSSTHCQGTWPGDIQLDRIIGCLRPRRHHTVAAEGEISADRAGFAPASVSVNRRGDRNPAARVNSARRHDHLGIMSGRGFYARHRSLVSDGFTSSPHSSSSQRAAWAQTTIHVCLVAGGRSLRLFVPLRKRTAGLRLLVVSAPAPLPPSLAIDRIAR